MSQAIDDLTHEHDALLGALKLLDSMGEQMTAGPAVEPTDVQRFLGFFREFADKCHHGKEEGLLFPALVQARIENLDDLLSELLEEHEQGRQCLQAMEAESRGGTLNAQPFAAAARRYAELLRSHIDKENRLLFPVADRELSQGELHSLYEAFENHEATVMGAGRHEELHALLSELKQRYMKAAPSAGADSAHDNAQIA